MPVQFSNEPSGSSRAENDEFGEWFARLMEKKNVMIIRFFPSTHYSIGRKIEWTPTTAIHSLRPSAQLGPEIQ